MLRLLFLSACLMLIIQQSNGQLQLLKDLNGTAESGVRYDENNAFHTVYNGVLYFNGNNGSNGSELWRTDGTTAGTYMVKDIYAGAGHAFPYFFTQFNGKFYFRATTPDFGLWVSDGTTVGTTLVKAASDLSMIVATSSSLFLQIDNDLWKSNGTSGGTTLVKDLGPNDGVYHLSPGANTVFFVNNFNTDGGLWKSDGTTIGTSLLKAGVVDSVRTANGKTYFRSYSYDALWVTDGTAAGTTLIKELPGELIYGSTPFNNNTYFTSYKWPSKQQGVKLWRTDGTGAGTVNIELPGYSRGSFPTGTSHGIFTVGVVYSKTALFKIDANDKSEIINYTSDSPDSLSAISASIETANALYFISNGFLYKHEFNTCHVTKLTQLRTASRDVISASMVLLGTRILVMGYTDDTGLELYYYDTINDPTPSECDVIMGSGREVSEQQVYPNPVKGKLYINNGDALIRSVSLTTCLGNRFYYSDNLRQSEIELDLSEAPKGIVILEWADASNRVTRRKIYIE